MPWHSIVQFVWIIYENIAIIGLHLESNLYIIALLMACLYLFTYDCCFEMFSHDINLRKFSVWIIDEIYPRNRAMCEASFCTAAVALIIVYF